MRRSGQRARALRAGANGYLTKHAGGRQLLDAVRRVLQGETYLSEAMRELQHSHPEKASGTKSPLESLSNRELEVFQLIAKGYGTRQIADTLHVSMKTVETHREHIREKLGIQTTFNLVQYALAWVRSGHA